MSRGEILSGNFGATWKGRRGEEEKRMALGIRSEVATEEEDEPKRKYANWAMSIMLMRAETTRMCSRTQDEQRPRADNEF
jgi:hypothetical protein